MAIRKYKPTSAGRRDASVSDFKELTKGAKPEKSLLRPMVKTAGRNNQVLLLLVIVAVAISVATESSISSVTKMVLRVL